MLFNKKEKRKYEFNLAEDHNKIISDVMFIIETELRAHKRTKKNLAQTLLLSEELLVSILNVSTNEGKLHLSITKDAWDCLVKFSAPGSEMKFDLSQDKNSESEIRRLLLDAYSDKLHIKYEDGFNSIRLLVGVKSQKLAAQSGMGFIAGLLVFLISKFILPESVAIMLCTKFFDPASDLLMNLLTLILPPVVFLSILSVASKLSGTKNMESDIGRQVIVSTFVTSVIATLVGFLSYRVLDLFIPHAIIAVDAAAGATTGSVSFLDVLFSMVPNNIFSPFIENNTLQIIFLGATIGLCINMIGERSGAFIQVTDALFELVQQIVAGVGVVVPFGIFCTTFAVLEEYGFSLFIYFFKAIVCMFAAFIVTFILYLFAVRITTGLDPAIFCKKVIRILGDIIKSGSGTDALPVTQRFCRHKLGVSPKIYNVTLPLGGQFNLDGSCIYMVIVGLMLAKLCGVTMYGNNIVAIVFSVVVLSIGAPSLTGSNIVCLLTLLSSIGVPARAIGTFMCLDTMLFIPITVLNTLGDILLSVLIAYKHDELDKNVYSR